MGFVAVPSHSKIICQKPINRSKKPLKQASELPSEVPSDGNIYRIPIDIGADRPKVYISKNRPPSFLASRSVRKKNFTHDPAAIYLDIKQKHTCMLC